MRDLAKKFKYCPYCGKNFRYECDCPYGKQRRMRMEFNDKLRLLFIKKFCPKCGKRAAELECRHCGYSLDHQDMFD